MINEKPINMKDGIVCDYTKIFEELSTVHVLRGNKILIPNVLRTQNIHAAHEGIVKTKQLLRSKYWRPGMDDAIKTNAENRR